MTLSRAQQDLLLAERCVAAVAHDYPPTKKAETGTAGSAAPPADQAAATEASSQTNDKPTIHPVANIYGHLCLSFPIFVRTCGLCQAVSFSMDKAQDDQSDRGKAHRLLLAHVREVLELGSEADVAKTIAEAPFDEYMRMTRRVVSAWVYFKRFAVSILHITQSEQPES